ncbi:MAG: hypothetical protein QOI97_4050, partial [Pseudomonas sp.]|nr:hypothetical protein [Pseudomonas sp.]
MAGMMHGLKLLTEETRTTLWERACSRMRWFS